MPASQFVSRTVGAQKAVMRKVAVLIVQQTPDNRVVVVCGTTTLTFRPADPTAFYDALLVEIGAT